MLAVGVMVAALPGCGGLFYASEPERSIRALGEVSRELPVPPGHGLTAGVIPSTEAHRRTFYAAQAPVVDLQGILHVGADVAPSGDELAVTCAHKGTTVSYGRVQDGVDVDVVIAYLNQQVDLMSEHPGFMTFDASPTVRLTEGASAALADYVVRAVRLINAALPRESRLLFSIDSAPPLNDLEAVPDGEILVDFSPWDTPSGGNSAVTYSLWQGARRTKAYIFIDPAKTIDRIEHAENQIEESGEQTEDPLRDIQAYYEAYTLSTVVHELIHAIGMNGHADPNRFPESVMSYTDDLLPGHALFPVDREVLQASYSVLEPGASAEQIVEDLGAWDDISLHLRGDIDMVGEEVAFGVASRNGLAQPWAFGPTPWTNLADNPLLSEMVTWSGRLLGLTPALEAVGGAADLAVELETLDGQLDFIELEHWDAHAAPGPIGSGIVWGDGDLRYLLNVSGNTFVQTGGDEGTVTGAFFGAQHEAMGGVLERTDLTAAFGGKR